MTCFSSFRFLPAVALALPLLASCAQRLEPSQPQASHYYLNGQPATKREVDALPASSIVRMDVLTGQQARTYAHDSAATGVVQVTTKPQ